MPSTELDNKIKSKIKSILKLESRIQEKNKDILDGDVSPFFLSLFGKNITLYVKVGQSIQTTIGMSFYEQVSKILGESQGFEVKLQHKIKGEVNDDINAYLTRTLDRTGYMPDRQKEVAEIKKMTTPGKPLEYPDSTVDVFVKMPDGKEVYIDITTVKPNKKEFRALKRKILTWTAMRWSVDPDADVECYIAIPYNPEQGNYSRHNSVYDRRDILVGDELWELVSSGKYDVQKLEAIFASLGAEVEDEINSLISESIPYKKQSVKCPLKKISLFKGKK